MKTNILFLIALIFCSQAYSTLFTSKESTMNYIVHELIELNREANTPQVEIESLLNKIADGAKATDEAATKVFGGIRSNCEMGKTKLDNFLKKLKADLLADDASSNKASEKLSKIAKTQEKLKKDILKTSHEMKRLIKRIRKQQVEFEQYETEVSEKHDVIKRLRDLINDELINGSKEGSFIQLDQLKGTINELQEKMKNLKDDSLITPLISALVTLSDEKNFSSQKILKKILGLLAKIDENLRKFTKKHITNNNLILTQMRKEKKIKTDEYLELRKMAALSLSDIKYYNGLISHNKISRALTLSQIIRKNGELKQYHKLCTNEKTIGAKFLKDCKEFQGGIKALREAVARLS